MDQKLSRKLVHMLAGPGFALCWPLFSMEPHARFCAALVPSLNVVRLLLLGFGVVKDEGTVKSMSRSGDRLELLRGPLYYVLVLIAGTLVFWRESPVGLVAISLMCGGDGLADIVGRRWGDAARLPWNRAKSWPGSAAMFLGGTAMALGSMAYFSALGFFDCDLVSAAGSVATIAAAATLMESLPLNRWLDDNLSVPGTAAVLGTLLVNALILA
ncbi:hypothetical protein WJX81_001211 [Elliptochloris bilobata]|uniref:phytol kinase n=1 Tax=Elliptochloris bilobata TaxID=381761 RepID=A0AAW1QKR6_9CHLO